MTHELIRVFPSRTKYTPDDEHAYFGPPDMFMHDIAKVHISCVFTWEKAGAERLADEWSLVCDDVLLGGPAFQSFAGDFTPGRYVRHGVTITSRGCPKRCKRCFVPRIEGRLRELSIVPGHIVCDNNLIAYSRRHVEAVFDMLGEQRQISFPGGIDAHLLQDWHVQRFALLGSRLKYLYMAYDRQGDEPPLENALRRLHVAGIKQQKIGCYVLVGADGDTVDQAWRRCEWVFVHGGLPFPMYYRPPDCTKKATPREWAKLRDAWWPMFAVSRVAKEGLRFHKRCLRGTLATEGVR